MCKFYFFEKMITIKFNERASKSYKKRKEAVEKA